MRQFVKVCADGRVSVLSTSARDPITASGETLIETTDNPIAPGIDVAVVDGAVVRTPRAVPTTPAWTIQAAPPIE
jgi:hypothetical protein